MAAESLAQLITLSANGAHRQVDAAAQFKELTGLARKVAISATMSRAFRHAA